MRFAFVGFDRWCGVFDAFVAAGWEPVAVFTMPVDHRHDFHDEIVARARRARIPVQMSRLDEDDLRRLADARCDVLVVAGYPWRVPDWQPYLRHAINFHPAPLPEGRGPYPPMQAILEGRRTWAVSCHRIAAEFDTGEILAEDSFALDADVWHETLQLQLQMSARRLASRVAADFGALWADSRPQSGGSYWPRVTDAQRTLDYTRPVAELMRTVRACGLVECIAPLNGKRVFVRRATAWQEAHTFAPGTVVHEYRRWVVIAAVDGFVALIEWSPLDEAMRERVGP
ncbi:MAG TPA: formyltransferase family protein [Paraburkholderia sp.]|jgi:methionyl-tRNA formyltransferase|nr:formyltransferase family protein [Paraburkholderia sp.]